MKFKTSIKDTVAITKATAANGETMTFTFKINGLEFLDLMAVVSELEAQGEGDDEENMRSGLELYSAIKELIGVAVYKRIKRFATANKEELGLEDFLTILNFNVHDQEKLPKGSKA